MNENALLTRAWEVASVSQGPVAGASRLELVALRRALTTSRREVHRTTWLRAVQARTTTIARVLRVVLCALRAPGGRVRDERGWLFYVGSNYTGTTVALRVITRTPTRSLTELARPIPVVVDREELVDLGSLRTVGEAIALTSTKVA